MTIKEYYTKNNPSYINQRQITVKGLILHSIAGANSSGKALADSFNCNMSTSVHAFIDADNGTVYQCLPWNVHANHGGSAVNGSYIGVEMCESKYITYNSNATTITSIKDKTKALANCKTAYDSAVELFAWLCNKFNLDPQGENVILSHREAHDKLGATNHGDPDQFWNGLSSGYDMDKFRSAVASAMGSSTSETVPDDKITKALTWAKSIADDNSHGYSNSNRWGVDYDCSSFVISALKEGGFELSCSTTHDMKQALINAGFEDVSSSINFATGGGCKKGDVLLNEAEHTSMYYDDGKLISAHKDYDGKSGDSKGTEINVSNYANYPYYVCLRFPWVASTTSTSEVDEKTVIWNNRVAEKLYPNMDGVVTYTSTGKTEIYINGVDATKYCSNISVSGSLSEISDKVSFDVAKTDAEYIKDIIQNPIEGGKVQIVTDKEVFRGIITEVNDGEKTKNSYTAVDLGWYLNKTKQTYQFKNCTVAWATKCLCDDLYVPYGEIPENEALVNQIYFDKTIFEILTDIWGGNYKVDFCVDHLRVFYIGNLSINPNFRIASNLESVSSIDRLGGMSHSVSIEDLRNSVKITSDKDNVLKEEYVIQDRDSINSYGFLQEIVSVDTDKVNPEIYGQEQLKALNQAKESLGFKILTNYDEWVRAGYLINYKGADYYIESFTTTLKSGYNEVDLTLVKYTGALVSESQADIETTATSTTASAANSEYNSGWTATTYGYAGDDNGVCGWNGLRYANCSGCHVAIPMYCIKGASTYNYDNMMKDFPEFEQGYGTILELHSPDTDKTVKAIVADCGAFGPYGRVNKGTAIDMPPNTFNALGLGHGTYKIEFRKVGYQDSWDGGEIE